nr:putative PEP-binding protein [Nocardia carnea]
MVRGEFVFRQAGSYITTDNGYFALQEYLASVCDLFEGKPVWYRQSDLLNCEISSLEGCDVHLDEINPNLGPRALRRGLLYPGPLLREIRCVTEVMADFPNLRWFPSFVGAGSELIDLTDLMGDSEIALAPFAGSMIETPAAVADAEAIVASGASRLVIGLNDLASLFLGAHRGSIYHQRQHRLLTQLVVNLASNHDVVVCNLESRSHLENLFSRADCRFGVHYGDLWRWFPEQFEENDFDPVFDGRKMILDVLRSVPKLGQHPCV